MNRLFSLVSKKYESQYNLLISKGYSNVETIKLLNDAILIAFNFFHNSINVTYTKGNIFQIFNYNKMLFCEEELVLKAFDEFTDIVLFYEGLLRDYNDSISLIKTVLGSVLEKHINRKETGAYYTPLDTTKYISWNTILISVLNKAEKVITKKITNAFNINDVIDILNVQMPIEDKIKKIKSILSKEEILELADITRMHRIIDPTCGSGAFIISSYEFLEYLNINLLNNKINDYEIFSALYGVDISEEAILLTKMRCILHFNQSNNFSEWFFTMFDNHFKISDALAGKDYVINEGDGFDWKSFDKFDCIIGNPPYVEQKNETTNKFISKKCGNLYAYTIERSCNIIKDNGMISFIVPLPFIATPRMNDIRNYLHKKSEIIYYSFYADRPGCLFTGVHQRLLIFFSQIGTRDSKKIYTSKYNYWYNRERENLFDNIHYYMNDSSNLPKIGNEIEYSIYNKINNCTNYLKNYFCENTSYSLWISTRIGFWAKAFMNKIETNELKQYYLEDEKMQKVIYCLINSSIFYYFWILTSDCWHVTQNDINRFKFDIRALKECEINDLCRLANALSDDLEKNKVKINSKQSKYEYKHKYSKHIIDEIDDILSNVYSLTNDEKEYVKNYTIKYRLNTFHKEVKK